MLTPDLPLPELPRLEVGGLMEAVHYSAPSSVSYNGFLFKTGSMARPITERKTKEGRHTQTRTHANPRSVCFEVCLTRLFVWRA